MVGGKVRLDAKLTTGEIYREDCPKQERGNNACRSAELMNGQAVFAVEGEIQSLVVYAHRDGTGDRKLGVFQEPVDSTLLLSWEIAPTSSPSTAPMKANPCGSSAALYSAVTSFRSWTVARRYTTTAQVDAQGKMTGIVVSPSSPELVAHLSRRILPVTPGCTPSAATVSINATLE
jgi:hypothetical protein